MAEIKKSDHTIAKQSDEDPATKRLRRTKDMLPSQYPGKEFYGPGNEKDQAVWNDGRDMNGLGHSVKATSPVFQRARAGDRFSDLGDDKARIPGPEQSDE